VGNPAGPAPGVRLVGNAVERESIKMEYEVLINTFISVTE
jgi:hypothetical protein